MVNFRTYGGGGPGILNCPNVCLWPGKTYFFWRKFTNNITKHPGGGGVSSFYGLGQSPKIYPFFLLLP